MLESAVRFYTPVLNRFDALLKSSETSDILLFSIAEISDTHLRIQLARIFRKYISPSLPVEMLKHKSKAQEIYQRFGHTFRPIHEAQAAFAARPLPDEALCALLWEYSKRGQKGYDLTERSFDLLTAHLPQVRIAGPKRAGADIRLGQVFENYPKPKRPVDFILYDAATDHLLAIGFARYDGDRGGGQEDDRIGGNRESADEILGYADQIGIRLKVIFINDGPGLLLGSMWEDYAELEQRDPHRILVVTLRMIPHRLTFEWLNSF